jgi:limonene-1,2-epoxide hydrolase
VTAIYSSKNSEPQSPLKDDEMAKSVATKNDNEKVVVDFIHAAYGQSMDIDAMTALMADDFVWQLHVPLSPVVRGRDAARAELEKHNTLSTGMVEGSEIRTIVSDSDTVVVERVDVNAMNGVAVTFHVTALFEVRDGAITHWREYWDTTHVAQQLGIDPALMFAPLGD